MPKDGISGRRRTRSVRRIAARTIPAGLYDSYLALRFRLDDADAPEHVAPIITERDLLEQGVYEMFEAFIGWAFEFGSDRVTISVSILDEVVIPTLTCKLRDLDAPHRVELREPGDTERANAPVQASIDLDGKCEFVLVVRSLVGEVDEGALEPDDIDAADIEQRLVFPNEPDFVVKTGAERLSDFMIWQSVYAELYFTDVNWRDFRKRDYLRALRDYQDR